MNLRRATPDDLPQVEAVVRAAYSPWITVIGATPGPMKDNYVRAIADAQVQVLDGAQGIEALLVLIPLPDALLLDNVAVAPKAQGKGHGRRLMEVGERAARAMGYSRIRLYTHEKMIRNIGIYGRLGYEVTNRVTERGLNRVYMEKRLLRPT